MADDRERNNEKKVRDERVSIPLDPEEALKGLLQVDPHQEPVEDEQASREHKN